MELLLTITAIITGICFSFVNSSVSIVKSYPENKFMSHMSNSTLGVLLKLFSYISGNWVGAHVALKHGLRIAYAFSAAFVFIGAGIIIQSYEYWPFGVLYLLGCTILDFGVSIGRLVGPSYMAQYSDKGELITLIGDTFKLGYLLCTVLEILLVSVKFPNCWQALVFAGCLFPSLQLLLIMCLRDSPPTEDDFEDTDSKFLPLSVFMTGMKSSSFRRDLLAATSCQMAQQLLSVDTILYLQPKLPYKKDKDLGYMIVCQIIGAIVNFMLVDRFNRKRLVLIGLGLGLLSSTLISFGFMFNAGLTQGPAMLFIISFYLATYSSSFGQLPEIISNDYFNNRFRVVGASFASLSASMFGIGVSHIFETLEEKLGAGNVFFLSAAGGLVVMAVLYICLPETNGQTPEAPGKQ